MKKLLIIFVILFSVSIYSQYNASDYQVIGYHEADTSLYLEAYNLHVSDHKPFGIVGVFRVSEQFASKYPKGAIFNYVVCWEFENYVRFIKYDIENRKVKDKLHD